jgi:hypothetical protein
MRAYSSANVMQEYLETPSNFFGRMFSSFSRNGTVDLEIMLPSRFVLKGELIAETVSERTESRFSQSDLVNLLATELLDHYALYPNPLRVHRNLKDLSSLSIIQRYYKYSKGDLTPIRVRLLKKDVFKLEMLLCDIEEVETTTFDCEKLLQYIYCNFMSDLIHGEKEDSVKKIIKLLS